MNAQPPAAAPVRIGLWGTFDLEDYGDALFLRIIQAELERRLPGATIRTFAPLGRPHRLDGGEPAEALGRYGADRVGELADELDCVVVGPGDIVLGRDDVLAARYGAGAEELIARGSSRFFLDGLGPELEVEVPVVWFGVSLGSAIEADDVARYLVAARSRASVAVSDEASRRRLLAIGSDRDVAVIPDPAILVPRLYPSGLLDQRLEHLRALGWFPPQGSPLVVQGGRALVPSVPELASEVGALAERLGRPVLVMEAGAEDGDFAAALAGALPGTLRALAPTVQDIVAAIRGSAGLVGSSPRAVMTALAFGLPAVLLAPAEATEAGGVEAVAGVVRRPGDIGAAFEEASSRRPSRELVARLQAEVDRQLDEVAGIAGAAAERRSRHRPSGTPEDLERAHAALREAYRARGLMLARQRWTFADRVRDAEARERATEERLQEEIGRLEAEIGRLEAEVAGKDRELQTLLNTRTFRYTAGLRRMWGALRGLFRR